MALFVDLVALSNGLHGSVQMDLAALFSWIGWLRHRGILSNIYQFVEKLERQTVKKLSSGEKKVVEIFSSLALHKKYLLLDEASNALDITNRQFLLDALISVSQKDIVVFYVSHNFNEIIKLNGEVYCFIPKFKTIKKIQNEELIDNRFKDLIMFGADSYE